MPGVYDNIDARWLWCGDLDLSSEKDLADTTSDTLQSLIDQIHIICASTLGDWEIYPGRGAALDDFIGEPNTRSTATRIRDRLRAALVSNGTVQENDLDIRIFPVHAQKVLIIIKVLAMAMPTNKLQESDSVVVSCVFDTTEHQVFFLDKTPTLTTRS
jgi:hypothetical protein